MSELTEDDFDYWCNLPAPTAAHGGLLCVRRAGHIGPGLFCTSNQQSADARDRQDAEEDE